MTTPNPIEVLGVPMGVVYVVTKRNIRAPAGDQTSVVHPSDSHFIWRLTIPAGRILKLLCPLVCLYACNK
jgi:hypothetical protein